MKILIVNLSLIALLACVACGRHNERLDRIDLLASANPAAALAALDSIDPATLGGDDRWLYDFLRVKVNDKNYIRHTSDSLILPVIEYARTHQRQGRYGEALYYGARVYSDMGDSPRAAEYFGRAIEQLDREPDNPQLQGAVLAQTGRLMGHLRVYSQAIGFVERAIDIDRQLDDTVNLVFDLQLLGGICRRAGELEKADSILRRSLDAARYMPDSLTFNSLMCLAEVKRKQGLADSALMFVRGLPERTSGPTHASALTFAALTYYAAGLTDTAYRYARELIAIPGASGRETGYNVLLSPELRPYSHPDTVEAYFDDYRLLVESLYNENESQMAIAQEANYNYRVHDRERMKAEQASATMLRWAVAASAIIVVLGLLLLYLRARHRVRGLELRVALDNAVSLRRELEKAETEVKNYEAAVMPTHSGAAAMRECLRSELMAIYERGGADPQVPKSVAESPAYRQLQDAISSRQMLHDDSPLWAGIELLVADWSPRFESRLALLTGGRTTKHEHRTALLIKCGVTPTQMAALFGRAKGTIVSRRDSLSIKVFGTKTGTKIIDGIIRLL